jgi:hypothetical protein
MLTMLATHPDGSRPDSEARNRAAQALAACAEYCAACADACLAEEQAMDLRRCIRMDLDCSDICGAAARVVARQTFGDASMFSSLLTACIEACERCAEECDQHAEHHEHCRLCAEACRRCASACSELLEVLMAPGMPG